MFVLSSISVALSTIALTSAPTALSSSLAMPVNRRSSSVFCMLSLLDVAVQGQLFHGVLGDISTDITLSWMFSLDEDGISGLYQKVGTQLTYFQKAVTLECA